MTTTLKAISAEFAGHMGDYAGVRTPSDFGDVRGEYQAIRQSCALYLLNWRTKIGLRGSDRVRWLNGMVTNNVRDLASGHGAYAFLLNPQGRILGDLYAYNDGDDLIIDTDQSQRAKVVATFEHFIIMDDVEIDDLSEKFSVLGMAGPHCQSVLENVGLTPPRLASLQFVSVEFQGSPIRLVNAGGKEQQAYELWISPEMEATLWRALAEAGANPVGSRAIEIDRIVRGIPRYGQDLRERDLPQETEQDRALNFNKGCYVGQEIVERIRSRGSVHRMFTGFRVDGPVPSIGAKIEAQGKEVGEVTSATAVPAVDSDASIALGYIRREAIATHRDVLVGGMPARETSLPFADLLGA